MDALRGIALILRTPRLWGVCFKPFILALFVYFAFGIAAGMLLLPHLTNWLQTLPGGNGLATLAGGAAIILWIVLFPFLFVLFGGIFFGFAFEAVAEAVEATVMGGELPPRHKFSFGAALGDTLLRLFLSLSLGLAAFLLSFPLGPLPGIVVAGIIGLLDYTAPAFLRRGKMLRPQVRRLFGPPDLRTLSFALAVALLSLIPFLGVLLLPGLIAGGTLLTMEKEKLSGR